MEHDRVDIDREATAFVEFGCAAQIDHGAQTERFECRNVGRRQAVEAVGAEQRAPTCAAAISGGVAAEITKVVHGLQSDQALRFGGKVGE